MSSELGGVRVVNSTVTNLAGTPSSLTTIAEQNADELSLRWSPDSQQLAFSVSGLIRIASGTDWAERQRLPSLIYGWPNWQPAP